MRAMRDDKFFTYHYDHMLIVIGYFDVQNNRDVGQGHLAKLHVGGYFPHKNVCLLLRRCYEH